MIHLFVLQFCNLSYQELGQGYQKANFVQVLKRLFRVIELNLLEDNLIDLHGVSFPVWVEQKALYCGTYRMHTSQNENMRKLNPCRYKLVLKKHVIAVFKAMMHFIPRFRFLVVKPYRLLYLVDHFHPLAIYLQLVLLECLCVNFVCLLKLRHINNNSSIKIKSPMWNTALKHNNGLWDLYVAKDSISFWF